MLKLPPIYYKSYVLALETFESELDKIMILSLKYNKKIFQAKIISNTLKCFVIIKINSRSNNLSLFDDDKIFEQKHIESIEYEFQIYEDASLRYYSQVLKQNAS